MAFEPNLLKYSEKIIYELRDLYNRSGYVHYKVNKFEEYDFYMANKSFIKDESILTFTDTNGKLMALKPDITLSIIKHAVDSEKTYKVCYNENVYRPEGINGFREITQTGLECIGDIDLECICDVLLLAQKSLKLIDENYILDLSHLKIISGALQEITNENARKELVSAVTQKNAAQIEKAAKTYQVPEKVADVLKKIISLYGKMDQILPQLKELILNEEMQQAYDELLQIKEVLTTKQMCEHVKLDFSIVNDMNYYNGIVFQGYVENLSQNILAGGRYDNLVHKMGKNKDGIGFAVYLDLLDEYQEKEPQGKTSINIALPKGRLGEIAYDIFEKAGYECKSIYDKGRKLIFSNDEKDIKFFWVKPSDVAVYVEKGVADIGIVGKDILLEQNNDVFELLDLGIGKCRMAVASKTDFKDNPERVLTVATKFPNIAKKYYNDQSRQIDIIKLNGSIEIAPLLGLSDVIVDIVESGKTLKENGLIPFETIVEISARLIANRASYRFKNDRIKDIQNQIQELIENDKDN